MMILEDAIKPLSDSSKTPATKNYFLRQVNQKRDDLSGHFSANEEGLERRQQVEKKVPKYLKPFLQEREFLNSFPNLEKKFRELKVKLEKLSDEDKKSIISKSAALFHAQWRLTSGHSNRWREAFNEQDSVEEEHYLDSLKHNPQVSPTNYKVENGKLFIDIQNLDFEHLSPLWQEDNAAAAEHLYTLFFEKDSGSLPVPDRKTSLLDLYSLEVHEAWKERRNVSETRTSYYELSLEEKNKDREKVLLFLIASVDHLISLNNHKETEER